MVTLLVLLTIGSAYVFWPKKRNRLTRRTRKLRKQVLPDPWSGGIVRHQKFYVTHWAAAVGRAYRSMERQS